MTQDKTCPALPRLLLAALLLYVLSPVDLIPDAIPILGLLDEVVIVPLVFWLALRLLPAGRWESYRARARQGLAAETGTSG